MHNYTCFIILILLYICIHLLFRVFSEGMAPEDCIAEKRNVTSKLPPFFEWVKIATYEGQRKIRERSYDLWGLSVSIHTAMFMHQ